MGNRKQLYLGSSVGISAYTHAYSGFMSGSASIPVHALPPRRSLIFPKAALCCFGEFFSAFSKVFSAAERRFEKYFCGKTDKLFPKRPNLFIKL